MGGATQVVPPLALSPTARRLSRPVVGGLFIRSAGQTSWRFCEHLPRERTKRCAGPRIMSGVGIYPTLLDTTITIAGSSAWTRRTNGTCRLNA